MTCTVELKGRDSVLMQSRLGEQNMSPCCDKDSVELSVSMGEAEV